MSIESHKPKHYVKGHGFDHLVNGMPLKEYPPDSYERQNWCKHYHESYLYSKALHALNADSPVWGNQAVKDTAFDFIYDTFLKARTDNESWPIYGINPLFPFEIEMLNQGFKMVKFRGYNACDPQRLYRREGVTVKMEFGIETPSRGMVFFCFSVSTRPNLWFQLENDLSKFDDSINGRLPPINP